MALTFNASASKKTGDALRQARIRHGLSLLQVESLMGIDHSQISRIERGQFVRASKNVQKLCKLLNCQLPGVNSNEAPGPLLERISALVERRPQDALLISRFLEALEAKR
jgi:transcriptional regulator with XRE-family HTH domain